MQLELFEYKPTTDELLSEVKRLEQRQENVRRGIYSRHAELSRMYLELKNEFDYWKKLTCQN